MANDSIPLIVEVQTKGVKQAAADLQALEKAASSTEKSTGGMSSAVNAVNAQLAAMGAKAKGAGSSLSALDPAAAAMAKMGREAKNAAEGVKAATTQLDKFNKEAKEAEGPAKGVAGALGSLSKFTGGLAIGAALYEMVGSLKSAIDGLDHLNDQVEMLGISAESLSALNFAGTLSGISADEMTQGLTRLSVKMAEAAEGGNKASAVFEKLGINVLDSSGKLKAADAIYYEVADAFSQMDKGAEKTALSVELFNRGGAKFVQMLSMGSDGLRKMTDEAKALGGVIDGDLVRQSDEFNDNLAKLGTLASSVGRSILSGLLPPLNALIADLLRGISAAGGFWSAMGAVATMPFGDLATQIKSVRSDLSAMEKDQKEAGYFDQQRYDRKIAQLKILQDRMGDLVVNENGASYSNEGRGVKPQSVAANSPSADYIALTQKMSGVSADFHKHLKILNAEYGRTGNLKNYQAEVKKLIETETQIGKDSIKKPKAGGGSSKTAAAQASEEAKAYQDAMKGLASVNANAQKSTLELSAAQSTLYDLMTSPAWATMPEAWKQTAIAQFDSARAAEMQAEKFREHAKAMEEGKRVMESMRTPEEALAAEIVNLNKLLDEGAISWDVYARAVFAAQDKLDGTKKKVEETGNEMNEFAKSAAQNIQSSLADFLFDPFEKGLQGMLQSFGKMLQRMIAEAAAAQIAKAIFGDMKDGKVGGLVGAALPALAKIFSANGNAFDDGQVQKFASGGAFGNGRVLTKPTMFALGGAFGVAGEAGPEGALPLKRMSNGKLGVHMSGGGGMTINQTINAGAGTDKAEVKRAAAAGARSVLGVANGARRYG